MSFMIPKDEFVMIDNFLIDVSVSEQHRYENEITDYPVESGASFSDNIRPKPVMVTIQGVVSDSPIGQMATRRNLDDPYRPAVNVLNQVFGQTLTGVVWTPSAQAFAHLVTLWNRRDLVTIRTSLATYKDMALESIDFPRDSGEGYALRFTATFKQVKVVNNERTRVAIPAASRGGSRTKLPLTTTLGPAALGFRLVDVVGGRWFDPDIDGFRYSARYVNRPFSEAAPKGVYVPTEVEAAKGGQQGTSVRGVWVLKKGNPVHLEEYESLYRDNGAIKENSGWWSDDNEYNDSKLKELNTYIYNGGKKRKYLNNRDRDTGKGAGRSWPTRLLSIPYGKYTIIP